MSRKSGEQELTGFHYEPLPSLPEAVFPSPELVGGESYEWAAISNLDAFFTKVYRYWHDKGFVNIVVGRLLNLAALGFTVIFTGFLLLAVDWSALSAPCVEAGTCDLWAAAVKPRQVLRHKPPAAVAAAALYLAAVALYWGWALAHAVVDLRDCADVRHFCHNKLGLSERQVQLMTWSEVVHRLVLVQRTTRLCAARDLDEADIVGRIMRKENYLIGMINRGVLALHLPAAPRMRRRFMLTKTLEWNLYWCVLDAMFDENFHIRQDFLRDEARLVARLRAAAAANLAVAPFLSVFLLMYFFMKNAERFYHHPGSIGSRRWSPLARWRLREFNELPHYIHHRLAASHAAACAYVSQFPSPLVTQVAKFVAFVAGSFAAVLLGMTLVEEGLLERPLLGRHLVWWLATTGIVLTISRTFISDNPVAFDPERAMAEMVAATHYLPRHWRGRAHTAEVVGEFSQLFGYKLVFFLEELASILVTPYILAFQMPKSAGAILAFVRDFTVRVDGVGDVCSLAAFDFARHGNGKYGAPAHCAKGARSKQGKMEKSFLTFVATYPTWAPCPAGRTMLASIHSFAGGAAGSQQQQPGSSFMHSAAGGGGASASEADDAAAEAAGAAAGERRSSGAGGGGGGGGAAARSHAAAGGEWGGAHPLAPAGGAAPSLPAGVGAHYPPSYAPTSLPHYPSTLFPGGPNAGMFLGRPSGMGGGSPFSGTTASAMGQWLAPSPAAAFPGGGGGGVGGGGGPASASGVLPFSLGGGTVASASDSTLLPINETEDLDGRVAGSQQLLQSFYESRDLTVQHRHQHRLASRSVLLASPGGGGGARSGGLGRSSLRGSGASAWGQASSAGGGGAGAGGAPWGAAAAAAAASGHAQGFGANRLPLVQVRGGGGGGGAAPPHAAGAYAAGGGGGGGAHGDADDLTV